MEIPRQQDTHNAKLAAPFFGSYTDPVARGSLLGVGTTTWHLYLTVQRCMRSLYLTPPTFVDCLFLNCYRVFEIRPPFTDWTRHAMDADSCRYSFCEWEYSIR